ncbi:hypothetical protein FFT09_12770 [Saccharomonospora piscinae]|nr:hypothetical protein FFT09_12770 [Saccharomonospora piscinae]
MNQGPWRTTRTRIAGLLLGFFVAFTGFYLAITSDNPVWLSLLQAVSGCLLILSVAMSWSRSLRRRAGSRS